MRSYGRISLNTKHKLSINMKAILSIVGYLTMTIGLINLLFMKSIWGICTYQYTNCSSLSSYANEGFIIAMGVGGFFSLAISGILFLGFSKVIETLEDIRDGNKKEDKATWY